MGCTWNMPANYEPGVFENCDADDDLPMGVYGSSTWFQGVNPTPSAHPAASSSNCHPIPTVNVSPAKRELHIRGRYGIHAPAFPTHTATSF
ncbi:hypothetical protein C0992_010601 [Termitomyces sp. T32_za158]|nr:hypothetical protein C0992_010601 [Termitomyces sp. T32_za158]